MNQDTLRFKLVSCITKHDEAESKKRGYNHHAFPLYLEAMDEALVMVEKGKDITTALTSCFDGRLLAKLIKAVTP